MATAFKLKDGRIVPGDIKAGTDAPSPFDIEAGKAFKMRAYSGGPLTLKEYDAPVVVDLAGMTITSQSLPVPKDHDLAAVLGQTTAVRIANNVVEAEGVIDETSDHGELAHAAAKGGLAWEASIGASVQAMEFYDSGESVNVNGRDFTGPVYVARKTRLGEISLVRRGADRNQTHVAIAASQSGADNVSEETIVATERARVQAVTKAAKEYPDIAAKAVAEGWDISKVNEVVLEKIRNSREAGPFIVAGGHGGAIGVPHITAALLVKSGQAAAAEKAYGEHVMEQSKRLHRMSMVDLCEVALRADGRDVPSDRNAMIRAGLSGGTLTVSLDNTANKSIEYAYQMAPATWRSFCRVRSAKNFKSHTTIRPSSIGDLVQKPRGVSFTHGSFTEATFTYTVDTFAKIYSVSREDLVDDDVGVFNDVLPGFGRAWARSLSNMVYAKLLGATSAFFDSTLSNSQSGGGSALSITSLGTAIKNLRMQKDPENNYLDLQPATLVVGPTNESAAKVLLRSQELRQTLASTPYGVANPWEGVVNLQVEPRLEDGVTFKGTTYTGSTTAWYLFADAANVPMVIAFLDGKETPTTESFGLDSDPNQLAMSWRVYGDAGAALGDYRAAQKSVGA